MRKKICCGCLVLMLLTGISMTSYAGSINKMSLSITAPEPTVDGFTEPQISTSSSNYDISDVDWKNSPDRWRIGAKQQAVVTLAPEEGYTFSGFTVKKNWTISGAEFVKCKRGDDNEILLTVSYGPAKLKLAEPENPAWDREKVGIAQWKKVKNASAYEVSVYVDDEKKTTVRSSITNADLSAYISADKEVWFEVRAVASNSEESRYLVASEWVRGSDDFYYEKEEIGMTGGSWINLGDGWGYKRPDGNMSVSQWEFVLGSWYYFGDNSMRAVGWKYINDQWYYFDEAGVMQMGWKLINNEWYYLMQDGAMAKGWCQVEPGKWYYLYGDGRMAKSTTIGTYSLNESGLWVQ